jgi:hypothetical protein
VAHNGDLREAGSGKREGRREKGEIVVGLLIT